MAIAPLVVRELLILLDPSRSPPPSPQAASRNDARPGGLGVDLCLNTPYRWERVWEKGQLPVVEAMACGAPVISSNRSSIPEVAGKAAILVNPEDVLELACVMEVLLEKPEYRRKLSRSGLERAQEFSWKKTAEQTLAVYQELAEC